MGRHEISDEQWAKIKDFLSGKPGDPGRGAADNRRFINAVLWIARTGAPWRDLPERFGPWNSVFQRFNRWSRRGVGRQILEAWQDPDLKRLMLDSTILRAHQHAAGALNKGGSSKRSVGRAGGSVASGISRWIPVDDRWKSPRPRDRNTIFVRQRDGWETTSPGTSLPTRRTIATSSSGRSNAGAAPRSFPRVPEGRWSVRCCGGKIGAETKWNDL